MEERKIKGIWWIDSDPNNKLNGVLEFRSPQNCYLILDGAFKIKNTELIKGFSQKGKPITLLNCFQVNLSRSSPGLATSKYHVSVAFINVEYESVKDISFKNISVSFSSLAEWAEISGIKIKHNKNWNSLDIQYRKPKDVVVYKDSKMKISLTVIPDGPTSKSVQNDISIIQTTYFNVSFYGGEKDINEVMGISYILQNFITFAVSKPVKVLKFIGQSDKSITSFEDIKYNNQIEILYNSISEDVDISYVDPYFMLFTYADIKSKSQSILKRWIKKSDTLDTVFSLYFSTLYKSDTFLNLRFLSLVQAIESYHRRTSSNTEIDFKSHKKRLQDIYSNLSPKNKEWLEQKLRYSHEPSLRNRLKSIFAKYNDILAQLVNKSKFVDDVVNTRNYNVHYDKELRDKSKRSSELIDICDVLKVMIELCFFTELGFTKTQYSSLIKKSYAYRNLKNT